MRSAPDAIRNTKLPPLPTPEVRTTEEPAPVEIDSAPEASRETPKPAISALPVDVTGAEIGDRVIIYSKKTTENLDAPDGSLILSFSYVTPTVRIDERPDAAKAINEQLVLQNEIEISEICDPESGSLCLGLFCSGIYAAHHECGQFAVSELACIYPERGPARTDLEDFNSYFISSCDRRDI